MNDSDNYRSIFINDRPLIDTRAPIEFAKGSFPTAVSLPLMTDSERQKVGTCYKQQGQQAAIELGHQLVKGATKAQRVEAWAEFARANPDGYLFCFRGGLRSQISQQWLQEAGVHYPRITGGYKAMRTFLIDTLQQAVEQCHFTVLDGLTGTGKTDVLLQLSNAIDLEGHANHRGSSFGKHATGQPSQIDFENSLAIDVLKQRTQDVEHFVLENEAKMIGSCSLPHEFYKRMQSAPIVVLSEDTEARIERILRDYVIRLHEEFVVLYGQEQGAQLYIERMQHSLLKIQKRLGPERYQEVLQLLNQGLQQQMQGGQLDAHRAWIDILLSQYYDPMYHYQQNKTKERVVFMGNQAEVLAYLSSISQTNS